MTMSKPSINKAQVQGFVQRQPHWAVAFVVILGAMLYWSLMATERYVSTAHVVMESPEINPTGMNISSLLSGSVGSGDLLLLRDHMLSVDMLMRLQDELDLRSHYSDSNIDYWSRLSADAPIESFYKYMQKRMKIEFDDYASVLRVQVQAYTPEMAQRITQLLLQFGEQHMNEMGQRLAREQVAFIEEQAQTLEQRLYRERDALLQFQNEYGLVSPTGTVEATFETVSRLQAEKAVAEARKRALASYQAQTSPEMVRLNAEIRALQEQIDIEQEKMASATGQSLNRVSSEYETLALRAQFALELYSNTLIALESTRVEAARKLKTISVLQHPTLPQFATEPRRLYNITLYFIFAIFLASIAHLVRSIVRDHKD